MLNKVDCLERPDDLLPWLKSYPGSIPISARTGDGLDELAQQVLENVLGPQCKVSVEITLASGQMIDFMERRTSIEEREYEADRVRYQVRLGKRQAEQLLSRGGEATIGGVPLRQAIDELWPGKSWSGPPFDGQDGVLSDGEASRGDRERS